MTQSAKRMASRVEATDISSSVSPATRAFLRRPAVSCSNTSRPSIFQGAVMASRVRPASGPVMRAVLAQKLVEQAGFADIGPSHQRQPQGLGRVVERFVFSFFDLVAVEFLFAVFFVFFRVRLVARRQRFQRFGQRFHAQRMFGGNLHRLAKAQGIDLGRRLQPAFAFVGGHDHRLAGAVQRLGDDFVARRDPGAGIDHEQQRIGFGDGGQGLLGHAGC